MTTTDQEQTGKGTPPSKQAKRDKEAARHWKKSSIDKTEIVKAERRMKEEARKQRDRLKDEFRIKDDQVKTQLLRIQEIEQLYLEEQQKRLEEEKKREKAEKALAEIAQQLEDTDEKLRSLVSTQTGLTTQIYQTHLDINNHLYEQHQGETKEPKGKQVVPKEISENEAKISEQISDIGKTIQEIDKDIKKEKEAQNRRRFNLEQVAKKK